MLLEIGMQTKPIELIRIVTFIVLGAILVFIAQPLLYQNRILNFVIKDQPLDAWISNDYTPGNTGVLCRQYYGDRLVLLVSPCQDREGGRSPGLAVGVVAPGVTARD
jgi:hypothetical protein